MFRRIVFSLLVLLIAMQSVFAAPTVSITAPTNGTKFTPPTSITLSANAADSTSAITKVEFYSGTALLGTATAAPYSIVWNNVPAGSYSITAKAYNSASATKVSGAVKVTVNTPPTVTVAIPGGTTAFAGLASIPISANVVDPDSNVSRVDFYRSGTLIGTVTTPPYETTWVGAAPGNYNITAKVTDSLAATATSTAVAVSVSNPITVAMSAPASGSKFLPLSTVDLAANAADTVGTISKVEFFSGTTLIGTANGAPFTFSWANVPTGKYVITAKATDSQGLVKTSSGISITVNSPPTVALTAPAAGTSYVGLATIAMAADVADSDGAISKVQFYRSGTLVGTVTAPPYVLTMTGVQPGTYSLTARVTDDFNTVITSSPVSVTVTNPVSVAMTTPSTTTRFLPPASIDLAATASDTNGTISKVDFYAGTTLVGTASSAPFTATWSNVPAGRYVITAKATDSQGIVKTSSGVTAIVDTSPDVTLTAPLATNTYSAPANVQIAANVTDSDGTINKVQFYAGSTLLATLTSPPYVYTWSGVAKGKYVIKARATDNLGVTTTSTSVTISVGDLVPPTVSLAAPANNAVFNTPATIPLTATAGAGPSTGGVAKVEFFNGSLQIGTATAAPYSINWSGVDPGTYVLTAKVTDALGVSATSAPVQVTVNAPPTVSVTGPASGASFANAATVLLKATAADSDGSIAKVEFFNGAVLLGTATAAPYQFSWANVAQGDYVITAKATDNQGSSTVSAPVNLTVNAAPVVSLSTPINDARFSVQSSIALAAAASEVNGAIAKVEFFNGSTLIATAAQEPFMASWDNVPAGTYSLTAKATDALGGTKVSAPVQIKVLAAPTVALTAPSVDANFIAPAKVTIKANATAATGATVSQVAFYQGAVFLGSVSAAPFQFDWNNVATGTYSVTAKATDDLGGVTVSDAVAVTVVNNKLPTVSVTATPSTVMLPAAVSLTATAADQDGTVAQVEFYAGTTLLGTVTDAPYTYSWANAAAGTYNVTAKATDNLGASTVSAAIVVTVNSPAAKVFYIHTDQINTPRVITDEANAVVWQWESDPFGVTAPNEDPAGSGTAFGCNLRFPGQYYDRETNLHYNYYRDYDPSLSRYVESDPIGLNAGLNTYAYVGNIPNSNVDPTGLIDLRNQGRVGSGYVPSNNFCATGECAAGIPPNRPGINPETNFTGTDGVDVSLKGGFGIFAGIKYNTRNGFNGVSFGLGVGFSCTITGAGEQMTWRKTPKGLVGEGGVNYGNGIAGVAGNITVGTNGGVAASVKPGFGIGASTSATVGYRW